MTVKLLTKQHFEVLCLKGGCTGLSMSTYDMSKCHIVGNHMSRLKCLALTLHVAPMPPTKRRLLKIAAMVAILDIGTNGF